MYSGNPFTAEEIRKIDAIPMSFILGKERSGTTLLQLMLNAHSGIIAPPESRFIILLYYRYGKTGKWTEKIIDDFCNDLFREGLFRNFWGIDKKELKSALIASKHLLTFPLICKIIFRISSPGKDEIHVFIDKNPLYYYFLPELNLLFPEAKYVHLVRDYRANLVSHRRVFTVKRGTDIAYRWMKVNMLIEEAKKRRPEKYFTLTYESLVGAPAKSMQDICAFLGLKYDNNMVENHQLGMYSNFNNNKGEEFRKVHEKVFHAINPEFIDSWKGKIPENELLAVEAVAGRYAEDTYHYKPARRDITTRHDIPGYFIMDLKYRAIKTLYRTALANVWLYKGIKKYVWKNF
jgi:Sulfotransferase family